MMKTRMLAAASAAVIVVVGGAVPRTSTSPVMANFLMFDQGDSPIEVGDGSIHGYLHGVNLNYWRTKAVSDDAQIYTATADDPETLNLVGFRASPDRPPAPIQLQGTGGWLVSISNADQNGQNYNQNSILFCSTATEKPAACMLGKSGGEKWIYLETHPKKQHGSWKEQPLFLFKRLYFHDSHPGCDNEACDHISAITIQTVNGPDNNLPGPSGRTYTCSGVDQCCIFVGGQGGKCFGKD